MRTRIISAVLLCAATGVLVGCNPETGATSTSATSTGSSATVAAPKASATTDDKPASTQTKKETETKTKTKKVPSFVGMGLQSAQDTAQGEGFFSLKSHDSLGRDRMQAFDRNWKVCSQNVKAGTSVPTDTTLDFGAVKLEETCPAKDEAQPSAAGGKMPDFAGKSVKAARAALDSGTSITVNDASGDDRWVLVESNWQVCTQTPAAGTALNGQPVTFTAAKFGESCP
ncbi:PASTA domain-containing protein [Streptomyces sp. NPDC048275]|uniref:PASTA domain-containing protein n=1 Tax=Streptomyces sp. NPDC048275 TaxID=3155629 RepID=UPI0033F7010F